MKRSALVAVAMVAAACGGEAGTAPPPRVVALFDPSLSTPVLPLPNDLARSLDTGLIDVSDAADATDAEKSFNAYLRQLTGFPTGADVSARFSAALVPETLPNQVIGFELIDGEARAFPVTYRYTAGEDVVHVDGAWKAAHSYAVAIIAGPTGVKGTRGETVVATPAFELLRARYPLTTCEDRSNEACRSANPGIKGTSLDDERSKAFKLERARLTLKPAFEAIEANGTPRESVAHLWSFTIATPGPAQVSFDPPSKVVPFPHDVLITDGHVALPVADTDSQLVKDTKAALNALDGFSTTAALVTERTEGGAAGTRIEPSSFDASQFMLINLDTPADVSVTLDAACVACAANATEPSQVRLTPKLPLRPHTRYAVAWLAGARTSTGAPLVASPGWSLATASTPYAVDGTSTVRSLSNESAASLEKIRVSSVAALDAAVAKGIPREAVLLGWTFTTQSIGTRVIALRNKPQEWNLPTAVVGTPTQVDLSLLPLVSQVTGKDLNSAIRSAFEGKFTAGIALDANGSQLNLDDPLAPKAESTEGPFTSELLANPRRENLTFVLVLPKTPRGMDGTIPLVVFQHGINRSRRDAIFVANTIAKAGYATLAIDHPFHGDRSYCTQNADCNGGSMCVEHRCPNGYASSEPGTATPTISGQRWSSSTNLAATRDQILQLVMDQAQLLRSVHDTAAGIGSLDVDDPATAGVVEKLDPSTIAFMGMSLGSVVGSVVVSAIPEFKNVVFNVGGGSPVDILSSSPAQFLVTRKQKLDLYLESTRGLIPGTQAYEDFYADARWMLDVADGQNAGRSFIDEPLDGAAKKRVFVSWVRGDQVVPNPTTELLIRSITRASAAGNFSEKRYEAGSDHSFMLNPQNAQFIPSQTEAMNWLVGP